MKFCPEFICENLKPISYLEKKGSEQDVLPRLIWLEDLRSKRCERQIANYWCHYSELRRNSLHL